VGTFALSTMLRPSSRRRQSRWGLAIGFALLAAVVATELAKPAAQRTWEGRIAGFLPYDVRRPSISRFRDRLWNPLDRRILVPTPFGVGWTVNAGRLLEPWVAEVAELQTPDHRS